ncbi:phosphotransferase family protein [Larkinella sp. VNQ87]|uniref:phosphotransferase family protein n=1 Tax=Larkinella sp. VNQ87 TaxID=3400921 RepID=UPI003C054BBD
MNLLPNEAQVLALLLQVFPEQSFKTARFIGEGMDSQAFRVNDHYVFRFPKRADVAENLLKEIALLPHLHNLPLAVPAFEWIGEDPETGWPFVGYPFLDGTPWTFGRFQIQSADQQEIVLQSLGNFLTSLHTFDLKTARQLGISEADPFQDYQADYQLWQDTVYPLLPVAIQNRISRRFESFLADARYFQYTPSLIHDDFSSDHILCDPETGFPRAVIDFGDIALGDPDLDLKYLYDEAGQPFIERMLTGSHYQTATEPVVLWEKLAFFNFCEAIQDALDAYSDQPDKLVAALSQLV